MLLTILIGIHVLVVALARTAVQSAADAGLSAAQAAEVDARQSEGEDAARRALAGASPSVRASGDPRVTVEPERGSVRVVVVGSVYSPVLRELHVRAVACGPLDSVPASQLTATDAWRC